MTSGDCVEILTFSATGVTTTAGVTSCDAVTTATGVATAAGVTTATGVATAVGVTSCDAVTILVFSTFGTSTLTCVGATGAADTETGVAAVDDPVEDIFTDFVPPKAADAGVEDAGTGTVCLTIGPKEGAVEDAFAGRWRLDPPTLVTDEVEDAVDDVVDVGVEDEGKAVDLPRVDEPRAEVVTDLPRDVVDVVAVGRAAVVTDPLVDILYFYCSPRC